MGQFPHKETPKQEIDEQGQKTKVFHTAAHKM